MLDDRREVAETSPAAKPDSSLAEQGERLKQWVACMENLFFILASFHELRRTASREIHFIMWYSSSEGTRCVLPAPSAPSS